MIKINKDELKEKLMEVINSNAFVWENGFDDTILSWCATDIVSDELRKIMDNQSKKVLEKCYKKVLENNLNGFV